MTLRPVLVGIQRDGTAALSPQATADAAATIVSALMVQENAVDFGVNAARASVNDRTLLTRNAWLAGSREKRLTNACSSATTSTGRGSSSSGFRREPLPVKPGERSRGACRGALGTPFAIPVPQETDSIPSIEPIAKYRNDTDADNIKVRSWPSDPGSDCRQP